MSAPSRKISVWLLVVLLPIAGYVGWYNYRKLHEDDALIALQNPSTKWHFVTEEHWLVDETARDIAEMLSFARDGRIDAPEVTVNPTVAFTVPPAKGAHESYDLQAKRPEGQVNATFQPKDYIWAPAEYAPFAQKLVAAWKLTPKTPATDDAAILAALTSPTPEVLRRESKRLTEALTAAPLDAGLHEQAALVTAAFALREAAGVYSDSRREISRVAAHLAVAQALEPHSSRIVRRMADAALQTLVGREAAVLPLLADLEHDTTPGAAAWARALRMHAITDWRQVAPDATLFEELETFFARTKNVGPSFAIAWLAKRKPAQVHDWRRIILEGGFGVDEGHQFAKSSIGQEINSLQTDWLLFHDGKLPDDDIIKALNEPAARCVAPGQGAAGSLTVLGWDFWSAQHQRHLCKSIKATIEFLRDKWGVPEYREAQQFVRKNFAGLLLFPLLERDLTDNRGDLPAIAQRVTKLLDSHPESVPASAWGELLYADDKVPALTVGVPQRWLKPQLPFGTTYDVCTRCDSVQLPGINETAWWEATLRLAPADYPLLRSHVWARYHKNPPLEVVETEFAPVKDYCLRALERLATLEENGHSPKFPETMQRVCELDAGQYFWLARYYLEANQPDQAAEAYGKGVELDSDRVRMSNECRWLVNYLDDHGQPEKALAIATEAAEVYSADGLEAMARLKEKHGQLQEAEDYFKKITERYETHQGELVGFYARHQENNPDYQKAFAALTREIFPHGMTKAKLADFTTPAEDGTMLTSDSGSADRAGLHAGDVIVALDGYRVQTQNQYMVIRTMSNDPKLQLIVWNNAKGYRELTPSVPGRRFNVGLADYHGGK